MIHVFGSLTRDLIFRYPGNFKTYLFPGDSQNLAVVADKLVESRGGTAANIAYNLKLLGLTSSIVSAIGEDSREYISWLTSIGIITNDVAIVQHLPTATAIMISDQQGNQIIVFYPGAMKSVAERALAKFDWKKPTFSVISAGEPSGIIYAIQACNDANIKYLFNPGQSLTSLPRNDLVRGVAGSKILLANETEFAQLKDISRLSKQEIVDMGTIVVVTLGNKGSIIQKRGNVVSLDPVAPLNEGDPTGAGDAYCAGLVMGYNHQLTLENMGKIASLAATFAVEHFGAMDHSYGLDEFTDRFTSTYGHSWAEGTE